MLSSLPVAAKAQVIGEGIVGFGGGGFAPLSADGVTATVDLNFATNQGFNNGTTGSAVGMVTCTRAAPPALADNSGGTWFSFGPNVPRQTDKGLLVEESRTQLVTNTTAPGMGIQNTGITSGQASPASDTTAMLVADNSTNSTHYIYGTPPATVATGTAYTVSAFFKNNGIRYVAVAFADGGALANSFSANADLVAGVITQTNSTGSGSVSSSGIQVYPNGWVRVWATGSSTTMTGAYTVMFLLPNGTTPPATASYVGTGANTYVWCPQNEAGAFPTSPIPNTSGASATRAADVVSLTSLPAIGSAVTSFAQGQTLISSAGNVFIISSLDDATTNNRVTMFNNSAQFAGIVSIAGANPFGPSTGAWPAASVQKLALAYTANSQGFTFNGNAPATGTAATALVGTALTHFWLGNQVGGNSFFDGYIQRVAIWPNTRISNAGLQTLTFVAPTCSNSLNFAQACNSANIAMVL